MGCSAEKRKGLRFLAINFLSLFHRPLYLSFSSTLPCFISRQCLAKQLHCLTLSRHSKFYFVCYTQPSLSRSFHPCRVWYCNRGSWGWGGGRSRLDWRCCHPPVCHLCCAGHCLQRLEQGEAVPRAAEPHRAGAEVHRGARGTGHPDPRGWDCGGGHCTGQIWWVHHLQSLCSAGPS